MVGNKSKKKKNAVVKRDILVDQRLILKIIKDIIFWRSSVNKVYTPPVNSAL